MSLNSKSNKSQVEEFIESNAFVIYEYAQSRVGSNELLKFAIEISHLRPEFNTKYITSLGNNIEIVDTSMSSGKIFYLLIDSEPIA